LIVVCQHMASYNKRDKYTSREHFLNCGSQDVIYSVSLFRKKKKKTRKSKCRVIKPCVQRDVKEIASNYQSLQAIYNIKSEICCVFVFFSKEKLTSVVVRVPLT